MASVLAMAMDMIGRFDGETTAAGAVFHLEKSKRKLDAKSRSQAVARAVRAGLV